MFLLSLLTCLALSAFSAQAKVVDSFTECKKFFYQGTEPGGMDQNAEKICQMLEFDDFLYATLYSVYNRIPLYSAYIFDPTCSGTSPLNWHLEPQLSSRNGPNHMVLERDCDVNAFKRNQALSRDYENTGYDRGHLYPNSYQCGESRRVTFTLTNAAPMDACFNRIHWKIWEGYLQSFLKSKLTSDNQATVYIVTGTVPGEERIPQTENRVTVPSHIWTAVCYKHHVKDTKSFSFGYIGINQPEFNIKLMSVSEMNLQLSRLYRTLTPVQIFIDNCFGDKPTSEDAKSQFLNRIKLPEYQKLQMSKDAQSNFLAVQNIISSAGPSSKRAKVTTLTATLAYDSSNSFFASVEKLKKESRSACLLIRPKKRSMSKSFSQDLRKREVFEGSESVTCQLVPEKSIEKKNAADGSPCISFQDNDFTCTCVTQKGKSKDCCSTPCLYQDQLKGFRCYSGGEQIECSPQYSLITVTGMRCRDDHPCATYGEEYYWCDTESDNWEYCSPPLWGSRAKDGKYCRGDHACAKYGKSEPWCYTDDDDNWNYCCTSDDCFSAVDYKTCQPDHPCGYHGKPGKLWCYTTDGSWNYCCKPCG